MSTPIDKPGSTPPVPNQPIVQTLTAFVGGEITIQYGFTPKTQLALYSYVDDGMHLIGAYAMYDLVFNTTQLYWQFEAKVSGTYTVQLQSVPLESTDPTTYPTFSVVVK